MRKIHLSIALIIISGGLLFSGCQSNQPKAVDAPEVLAEFEIQGGMNFITLPVTFQGKEYPFVLDTGSTTTIFDDSFKDKLGKQFMWPIKRRGPEGKIFKVVWYHGHDAYVGPLKLEYTDFIRVRDLDQVVAGEKRDFQGIISMEFLKKYTVQIDFDNKKVTFFRGKKEVDIFSPQPKKNRHPEWGEPIPLKKKLFCDRWYVKGCILNNMKVDFLIDTGWLSLDSLKSRIFGKIYSQKNTNEKSSSTGFSSYNIINQVENFSVGSFEYKNHVFRRSTESILGLSFFRRHLVTLDFPNNIMYLKKGDNFYQLQRPAIVISLEEIGCEVNAESFVVTEIDPNGFAYRKGIREKDILTKIIGQDVSSFNIVELSEFVSQLPVPKNGESTFTFKHGDETITVPYSKRDMDASKN
jgi:hypothetical protein